jgi:hypothetical protein
LAAGVAGAVPWAELRSTATPMSRVTPRMASERRCVLMGLSMGWYSQALREMRFGTGSMSP